MARLAIEEGEHERLVQACDVVQNLFPRVFRRQADMSRVGLERVAQQGSASSSGQRSQGGHMYTDPPPPAPRATSTRAAKKRRKAERADVERHHYPAEDTRREVVDPEADA